MREYIADFETSVYFGQTETEVWGGSIFCLDDEIDTENVKYFNSIESFIDIVKELSKDENIFVFFHNLKFDGSFIIDYLMRNEKYKECFCKKLTVGQYHYLIDNMGVWYNIVLKLNSDYCVYFLDSLKLLPFSVKEIGKCFNTKYRKTEIDYDGNRKAGYIPSDKEKEYMANDVLVVAEALKQMRTKGYLKNTIGGCCFDEYKNIIKNEYYIQWKRYFPNLTEYKLDKKIYGADNAEQYIRKSYRGGWCYLKDDKKDVVIHNGCTYDVNSLYPSMMLSDSGNVYPIGEPTFWSGAYIPEEAKKELKYYFVRIKGKFELKPGYLPMIQIKDSPFYSGTEMLKTSKYKVNNIEYDDDVTLTVTMSDWKLINSHYFHNFKILDGCFFDGHKCIFDFYIDKYAKIKMENKGAKRTLAKLFLNNLYGQFAKSPQADYKTLFLDDNNEIKTKINVLNSETKATYIPIGSAITSYARCFTINAAQANYEHFVYADTDSIHCDCEPESVVGIKKDDKKFLCWGLESIWDDGFFHRQKTYIEKVKPEYYDEFVDGYNIKGAGCPERCKKIFIEGLKSGKYKYDDYKQGLQLNGKLVPKRIKGGIILTEETFTMKE